MQLTPSGGPIGATITGVDLSAPQSPELTADIRRAWLEHLVLVFPDQPLSPDRFLAFAQTIGTPGHYPFVTGLDDYPEVIEVKKLAHETTNFGGIWHSDTVYLVRPPMGSMLVARELPPTGGDTEFANMYLAYETLPQETRQRLDQLRAINRSDLAEVSKTRADRIADTERPARQVFEAEHPVVRTHPETGRKALFVNVAHTERLVGVTEQESRQTLDELFAHQIRDEFVWRLQWQVGMLTLWDNRCLLHNPINDYHGHRRIMHRVTLDGDVPR